jgi:peptidoglycan/LPS O-acetylase OafA/YrhL
MQREYDFSHRLPELDGIRGTAILAVVLFHWIAIQGQFIVPARLEALLLFGWSGVDLFFVLSGFLIGGILLDSRGSVNYFKVFYMRRFYRILPLYGAICLATLIMFYVHLSTHPWLFRTPKIPWYSYLTFGQNFWMVRLHTLGYWQLGVTWSLAVEEQFYLTLPFVIRFASRRTLPYLLGFGILLAPLIRVVLWFALDHESAISAAQLLAPCRMDALLLGLLAAWAVREAACWEWLVANRAVIGSASIVLGVGLLELIHRRSNQRSFAIVSFGYTLIALFYLSLLVLAVTQSGFVSRLFRFRGLTELGIVAYGLYLFHMPVIGLVYALAGKKSPELTGVSTFALTLLSGLLLFALVRVSWLYFEKPLINIGHRYLYRYEDAQERERPAQVSARLDFPIPPTKGADTIGAGAP